MSNIDSFIFHQAKVANSQHSRASLRNSSRSISISLRQKMIDSCEEEEAKENSPDNQENYTSTKELPTIKSILKSSQSEALVRSNKTVQFHSRVTNIAPPLIDCAPDEVWLSQEVVGLHRQGRKIKREQKERYQQVCRAKETVFEEQRRQMQKKGLLRKSNSLIEEKVKKGADGKSKREREFENKLQELKHKRGVQSLKVQSHHQMMMISIRYKNMTSEATEIAQRSGVLHAKWVTDETQDHQQDTILSSGSILGILLQHASKEKNVKRIQKRHPSEFAKNVSKCNLPREIIGITPRQKSGTARAA